MHNLQYKFKKAIQAVNYFATSSGGKIPKLKAIKLLWLADRLHVRNYGRTISGDTYFAMKLGPVASSTLDILNGRTFDKTLSPYIEYSKQFIKLEDKNTLKSISDVNKKVLSNTDIEVLDSIIGEYLSIEKYDLSHNISHHFPEWTRFKKYFQSKEVGGRYKMDMNDFFKDMPDYALFGEEDQEIKEIAKSLFTDKQAVFNCL